MITTAMTNPTAAESSAGIFESGSGTVVLVGRFVCGTVDRMSSDICDDGVTNREVEDKGVWE